MDQPDRSVARALRTASRPDIRSLRSGLDRLEKDIDALMEIQDEEIDRLRRMVVDVVAAYRAVVAASWNSDVRVRRFTDLLDAMCLEADAIRFEGDLKPKGRPARRRVHG